MKKVFFDVWDDETEQYFKERVINLEDLINIIQDKESLTESVNLVVSEFDGEILFELVD